MSAGERLPGTPEPGHWWKGKNGCALAGDAWGNPRAPLVVLLHGGGQTRHAWKNTGARLADAGYYAIAFDARGHGDSDWAADGLYGQDAMVDDLARLLAELGDRRAVLVGASMGGLTSLIAAGEKRIPPPLGIVLVDVAPRLEPEGVGRIHSFMSGNPQGFASLQEVADSIAAYQPQRERRTDLSGLAKNVRIGANGRYVWHWDARFRAHTKQPWPTERLEECARRLTVPTLLVRGGTSDVLSEAGAAAFLHLCPQAEYINVAGAAHMVAGDQNDVFGAAILPFLRTHVRPSAAEQQNPVEGKQAMP
jgi:non-heme chloroperoxidase